MFTTVCRAITLVVPLTQTTRRFRAFMDSMQLSLADIDSQFPRLAQSEPDASADNGPLLVRRLSYGDGHRDQCLDYPTWKQVEAALSRLDGHNDVLLELQGAFPYLVVGGGRAERYLVAVGFEHSCYFLCSPHNRDWEDLCVVLGGQSSLYPGDLSVDTEMVMKATWSFAKQGALAPSLRWVEGPEP